MEDIKKEIEKQIRRVCEQADITITEKEKDIYFAEINDYSFYVEYTIERVNEKLILRTVYMHDYNEVEKINKELSVYITELKDMGGDDK